MTIFTLFSSTHHAFQDCVIDFYNTWGRLCKFVQRMLVTILRPCISKPGYRHHKVRRCVCVFSVGQMLECYVATELADVVAFVTDHENRVRVCVLHALTAVCSGVSGTVDGSIQHTLVLKKQLHRPGSPKITTELTAFIVSAGNNLAALWTSCPPWEYPLTTIFESGHESTALVTSEALSMLAHPVRHEILFG